MLKVCLQSSQFRVSKYQSTYILHYEQFDHIPSSSLLLWAEKSTDLEGKGSLQWCVHAVHMDRLVAFKSRQKK